MVLDDAGSNAISFEQSKKDALNLVTSKIKIFTKDDKNSQGLKCSFTGCYFTTSATLKKCKARKQIKQHEEKHKKEEKALIEATIVTNDALIKTDEATIVTNDETKIFDHHKVQTTIAETTNADYVIDAINSQVEHTLLTNTGSDNGANGSTGNMVLDDTGEGGHILSWGWPADHKTTCALCGTSFPTIDLMEYDDIYCPDGCPEEALERSANCG